MKLNHLTAHEILELIAKKEYTAKDIYQSVHYQIEKTEKEVHAYANLTEPASLSIDENKSFPIPIAIKDNMCILDQETTCSSNILKGFKPSYDATVIQKLKDSGAIIVGHANMDEFAFGSSTETSCYGPTHNPWNLDCVPGGSSGGSTAAVASNQAIWAIGSDTGGSIRQPAAFCGVVGLKPTYGRVSRYGLIAFASSLDQIGPITKDIKDSALLMNIIAGHDPKDSTSINRTVPDYTNSLVNDVNGLRIGIPKEYFIDGIDAEVKQAVLDAIETLKERGATLKEVSLPHTEYAVATYYIIATSEASSNLARFDGVQYGLRKIPAKSRKSSIVDMYEETRATGFGTEAKRRIMLGTYSLSSGYYDDYYLKGLKVRTLIKQDFDKVFKDFDAIITPTTPTTAFKIGEKTSDPISMYLSDIFTISANLSGIPAISIPCGFSSNDLPIGMQIMAKPFDEEMLFRIGYTYQQITDWHKKRVDL
ncbi:MAG: Asp-tRNA(Asn)/Glu-tRNA(Gln) amidotransferase subunit GatA [Candidatus Omnitrophica bacterium]|nr:Asp-tRNA(Asn)/Glu-tRNA(Gln) amidotransferase subunit GatA [Candidatus Omnitrophota bacterium]MBU1996334.1 Asp-tRNA(Asn)/Glu-tRNA(Gln) amidotransferase subunit GatA [Candidatus Omnitrophota bacterium]MBU4333739.1 Asp-tRNA(Asn)/Glu-tRNA(Gln) amidotransferase subunit GatA [Candidatus Omnitrophota bacterium]